MPEPQKLEWASTIRKYDELPNELQVSPIEIQIRQLCAWPASTYKLLGFARNPALEQLQELYVKALLSSGLSKSKTAKVLKIDRRTLYRMLERWAAK